MMNIRNTTAWIIVLAGSASALAVPFIFSKIMLGSFLPPVLTQLESDSLYYLTLIQAVLRGDIWAGNPYILEYHTAMLPAMVLPLWISALPGIMGLPINTVFLVNALLYGVITGVIVYVLNLKLTNNDRLLSAGIAVLAVASVSNSILRPAVLQTVFPVFGLFMIALLGVLEHPGQKNRYVVLGALCAIAFYLYPHLWMQNFSAVGLLSVWAVWKRDRSMILYLSAMWLCIVLLVLPQILVIATLLHDPESILLSMRNSLIETRAILPLTVLNNKYTIVSVITLLFLSVRGKLSHGETLLLLLGAAILITATSNTLTGKETDFPTHPWLLGLLVTAIGITVFSVSLKRRTLFLERCIIGFCLFALVFTATNRAFIRMNAFSYIPQYKKILELHELQRGYDALFAFINVENIRDSVFLADERLSALIPLYTENFVFFSKKAGLHVIPDDELMERFLVYYVDVFDAEFMRQNVDMLRGVSTEHAMTYANMYPDPSLLGIVKAFFFGLTGKALPGEWKKTEEIDFIGGEKFIQKMFVRHRAIRRNYKVYLKKYHVQYILKDKESRWNPQIPLDAAEIYNDGRFSMYAL